MSVACAWRVRGVCVACAWRVRGVCVALCVVRARCTVHAWLALKLLGSESIGESGSRYVGSCDQTLAASRATLEGGRTWRMLRRKQITSSLSELHARGTPSSDAVSSTAAASSSAASAASAAVSAVSAAPPPRCCPCASWRASCLVHSRSRGVEQCLSNRCRYCCRYGLLASGCSSAELKISPVLGTCTTHSAPAPAPAPPNLWSDEEGLDKYARRWRYIVTAAATVVVRAVVCTIDEPSE